MNPVAFLPSFFISNLLPGARSNPAKFIRPFWMHFRYQRLCAVDATTALTRRRVEAAA